MKTAIIKLTAAISLDGNIAKAGEVIEIPEDAAKNLLQRGKAELATAADEQAAEEADEAADEAGEGEKPARKSKK